MNTLSIITVCKNSASCISDNIKSVLATSINDFELTHIFIDGKSSDETVKVIESYRNQYNDKNIKLFILSEKDSGIYDAMNKGITLSQTEWIAFLNSDDRISNEFRLNVEGIFHYDIVYGNIRFIRRHGSVIRRPKGHKFIKRDMTVFHPMSLVKKSVYSSIGLYSTKYTLAADYEFFLRCKFAGFKFHHIDETFVDYSTYGTTNKNMLQSWQQVKEIQHSFQINSAIIYFNYFFKKFKRWILLTSKKIEHQ